MKLYRSIFATGAAAALLSFAGIAQAGTPSLTGVSGAPNPSTVGQPVTITATLSSGGITCSVPVVDQTNGNASLCTVNFTGSSTATCIANFATPGSRIVGTNGPGFCSGAVTYSQTVNAAPTAVPTVGEWTLWGLAGTMLIGGGALLARRTRRFS